MHTSRANLRITTSSKFSFALASQAVRQIETEGTVRLSSVRFAVRGLMFSSLRGLSSAAVFS